MLKEVFIFVAGATPQIITETIYALSQKDPPVYPHEIYIITTSTGKKIIKDTLVKKGILNELFTEYNIPPVTLKDDSFIVPKDENNRELDDIKDDRDNAIVGNCICSFIKEKAKEENSRLHCSIAGGRKTMSFYLGSALQLFGRQRDKLYHVLVSPEFEANPEFFYKPRKNRIIKTRDGKELHTKNARIFLAELPFIRLGNKFFLSGKTYNELVIESQREIDSVFICPPLIVSLKDNTIRIGGDIEFSLQPSHLAFYTALLSIKLTCNHKGLCEKCNDCYPVISKAGPDRGLLDLMNGYYRKIKPFTDEEMSKTWNDPSLLRQYISKINDQIEKHVKDEKVSMCYKIKACGSHGNKRYGIALDKNRISIE
jgi:CRISPR-associated protein (TIGR02584 family)